MTEVKINVCGVEMTPDQAKKVYQELGKLFNPAPPSIFGPVRSPQNPIDRFPPISTWPSAPPVFLQQPGLGFEHAKKSPD